MMWFWIEDSAYLRWTLGRQNSSHPICNLISYDRCFHGYLVRQQQIDTFGLLVLANILFSFCCTWLCQCIMSIASACHNVVHDRLDLDDVACYVQCHVRCLCHHVLIQYGMSWCLRYAIWLSHPSESRTRSDDVTAAGPTCLGCP